MPEGLGLRVEPHRRGAAAAERIVHEEIQRMHARQVEALDLALHVMREIGLHGFRRQARANDRPIFRLARDDADIGAVALVAGTRDRKRDQRNLDANSPYLFQRTSSSLIQGAVSGGYNIYLGRKNKWLLSPYAGGGYLNIGEPRLVRKEENVFRQQVIRMGGIFGKAGYRVGYKTKIKFLQTIYLDASWWQSPVTVQGARLQGLSLFIGTRMSM